ncbi:MAG: FAD-dependent oxidoreductase [Mucilaginibacter sp.]|uniref:FAD-dependent oxidoreductase n=1 Tax=Mucilaginibacter sp. TaxID=1882438 RepID=UPI0034E3C05E
MIPAQGHYPVLIVGAGPSGLMMAAQLLRYGVQPIIIDIKKGLTDQSRALAVQARSMEIYRQMGLADRALQEGIQAETVSIQNDHGELVKLSLQNLGQNTTPFPFVHLLEQSKNERILLDFLTQNCCPVYWNTGLSDFSTEENKITAHLKSDDKRSMITCDWLIGADGAHSFIRKKLQIEFKGDAYANKFYLADIELNQCFEEKQITLRLGDTAFTGFFPMKGVNRFRVVATLPKQFADREEVKFEEIKSDLTRSLPENVAIEKCHAFSIYKLHHRMAAKFSDKRSFLIGDAAHIHSPVGGQGMNTGLQDAYNLAWKLAGVINQNLQPAILESYAEERMPVARRLLQTTDRFFNLINAQNTLNRFFRNNILPNLIRFFWKQEKFREFGFETISQTGINYRQSKINLNFSKAENVKAGDRLPFIQIFDEKKKQQTDLHAWCSKPGFTFIALGKLKENDLFNLARWITQHYPQQLNFFYLPFSAKNKAVFDCFELKEDQHKAVIVRPDMYIGYLNDTIHVDLIDQYLEQVAGCIKAPKKHA